MNTFLFVFTTTLCLTYFLSSIYRNRHNLILSVLLFLLCLICAITLHEKHFLFYLLIGWFYAILQYDNTIFNILKSYCIFAISYCISFLVFKNIHTEIASLLLYNGILFFYLHSFIKLYKAESEIDFPKSTILIVILITSIVLIIAYLPIKTYLKAILYIFIISCSLLCLYAFINSINSLNSIHEKHLQRYMQSSSQNKYDLLNQQYQSSFNLLHEIMHKCNELVVLMQNKQYEEVETSLQEITEDTFKQFNDIYSNSVIFNTLLQNRKNYLSKNKITVKSTIECNSFDFISFNDQVDLLNALLDFILNEAKLSSNNKIVFIKSNIVANRIVLSFRFANNQNKTLEREIHGAISNTLDHYNAIFSINEIDEKTLSLLIIFPITK